MIADYTDSPPEAHVASSDSPAILRLKMLEMKIAAARVATEEQRRSAHELIGALRGAIAARPALSFADLVAKLKTCDEMAVDGIGERATDAQLRKIKSAIAEYRRRPSSD